MKGTIIGFCVALAVTGFEIAAGIEMGFGVRMMIVIPLTVAASLIAAGGER